MKKLIVAAFLMLFTAGLVSANTTSDKATFQQQTGTQTKKTPASKRTAAYSHHKKHHAKKMKKSK